MSSDPLILDGQPLTRSDVIAVARGRRPVEVGSKARRKIQATRKIVDRWAEGPAAIYGVNTGFGSFSRKRIAPDDLRAIQHNLLRSHAAGVGDPLSEDAVRAMMLILAASLARGCSGVRVEVVERLVALLNLGMTPMVPSRGSVGASGDLAPLAHLSLPLIGEGMVTYHGRLVPGTYGLRMAGLDPLTLESKEGLALINGTHLMAALGVLALDDAQRLFDAALSAAALAVDACRATDEFLDERIHEVRCQPGQREVAKVLRELLAGSQIIPSHRTNDPRVQDPYCLRAAPQVLGGVSDALAYVDGVFERELGAVTDNPLVFAEEEGSASDDPPLLTGGNFHGLPLALALDTFKIALCHLAGIAERRIYWLLQASDSENPVNAFLSPEPGLHSGLMIVQYTAAACCNELQVLAAPASIHNIPTSAGIEDYNSMGATSALHACEGLHLATNVIAIELLVMTEAMEYQRPLRSGEGVERVYETVRSVVPRLTQDRPPAPDIAAIAQQIRAGTFDLLERRA